MVFLAASSFVAPAWGVDADWATSAASGTESEQLEEKKYTTAAVEEAPVSLQPRGTFSEQPIRPGDKINIVVRGEKDLSGIYIVDVKGDLNFPLVGKIHAERLTLEELNGFITAALKKDFYTNPQLEVTFQDESAYNSVSVLGEVMKPGNYLLSTNDTFLRMITAAGGFNTATASPQCKIMRSNPDGTRTSLPVDVEGIMGGRMQDAELRPGDIIFVPAFGSVQEKEDPTSSVVVLGQVGKPGAYKIVPGMTVLRLLSLAGGLTLTGDSQQVTLSRKDESGKSIVSTIDIDAILRGEAEDAPVRGGDTLSVPTLTPKRPGFVDISRAISILGEVNRPGNYEYVKGATLTWLISEAGGFKKEASWRVRITRTDDTGQKTVIQVDAGAIIQGKAKDVPLQSRDIVFVPESFF